MIWAAAAVAALGVALAAFAQAGRSALAGVVVQLRAQLAEAQHESFQRAGQLANQKQEVQLLRSRLGEAERLGAKLAMMTNDLSELRARLAEADVRQNELPGLRETRTKLEAELQAARSAVRQGEAQLAQGLAEQGRLAAELQAQVAAYQSASAQARQLEVDLAVVRKQRERELALQRQTGLAPGAPLTLATPAGRTRARGELAQALGTTGAQAAALVDEAGLVWVAAGDEPQVRGLARLAAAAADLAAPLAQVLEAPVVRLAGGDERTTAALLAGAEQRWLGLAIEGPLSWQPLQLLGLRLGALRPLPTSARSREAAANAKRFGEPSAHPLAGLLGEWQGRWGAEALAVRWSDGVASTHAGLEAAMPALEAGLEGWLWRALRAGLSARRLALQAVGANDRWLDCRWMEGPDAPQLIAAVGQQPLPAEALDELIGALRWSDRRASAQQVANG